MNAAVTIETRCLESFPDTVRAHMKYLKGFDLVIFGGDHNEDFLSRNLSDFVHHKVKLSPFGNVQCNQTMTNPKFWEVLAHYDRVLIFQHDSMLLRTGIEDFLKWDYIGAPWTFQQHGGNGGLSIRNPSVMLEICRRNQWQQSHGNEDVFFCNLMRNKYNLAPRAECEKFSVERIFKLGTLGYHAIDNWLSPDQCDLIRRQYEKNLVPTDKY